MLLPLSYFVGSSSEASRNSLADSSLRVLLTLIHYRKCILVESVKDKSDVSATSDYILKEETYFSENPYCKALENAGDIECEFLLSLILPYL